MDTVQSVGNQRTTARIKRTNTRNLCTASLKNETSSYVSSTRRRTVCKTRAPNMQMRSDGQSGMQQAEACALWIARRCPLHIWGCVVPTCYVFGTAPNIVYSLVGGVSESRIYERLLCWWWWINNEILTLRTLNTRRVRHYNIALKHRTFSWQEARTAVLVQGLWTEIDERICTLSTVNQMPKCKHTLYYCIRC